MLVLRLWNILLHGLNAAWNVLSGIVGRYTWLFQCLLRSANALTCSSIGPHPVILLAWIKFWLFGAHSFIRGQFCTTSSFPSILQILFGIKLRLMLELFRILRQKYILCWTYFAMLVYVRKSKKIVIVGNCWIIRYLFSVLCWFVYS